jgi:hypothetical protein
MNPWLLYGGLGLLAFGAYALFGHSANAAPTSSDGTGDQSVGGYGLPLSTGFGTASGGDAQLGGASTGGSALDKLAAALTLKSNNDLQLGLAQTDTMKSLGLGALSNAYMHDVFSSMPLMAKAGISKIGGMVGGVSQSATLTYSDPNKNVSLGTGYNANGDLVGADGSIIKQSNQSVYTSGTWTDIHGVLHDTPMKSSGIPIKHKHHWQLGDGYFFQGL